MFSEKNLSKTISLPPSLRLEDIRNNARCKLLETVTRETGFVVQVKDVEILNRKISFMGNYIFTVYAKILFFLPVNGMEVEAQVIANRDTAHVAKVLKKLTILFYSDKTFPPDSIVKCKLVEVKFQRGTYRAIAELLF